MVAGAQSPFWQQLSQSSGLSGLQSKDTFKRLMVAAAQSFFVNNCQSPLVCSQKIEVSKVDFGSSSCSINLMFVNNYHSQCSGLQSKDTFWQQQLLNQREIGSPPSAHD